jgi:hypothetical protein
MQTTAAVNLNNEWTSAASMLPNQPESPEPEPVGALRASWSATQRNRQDKRTIRPPSQSSTACRRPGWVADLSWPLTVDCRADHCRPSPSPRLPHVGASIEPGEGIQVSKSISSTHSPVSASFVTGVASAHSSQVRIRPVFPSGFVNGV